MQGRDLASSALVQVDEPPSSRSAKSLARPFLLCSSLNPWLFKHDPFPARLTVIWEQRLAVKS